MFGAVEQPVVGSQRVRNVAPGQDVRKMSREWSSLALIEPGDQLGDRLRYESEAVCRSILGVSDDASWEQICEAHARLVADMTPGPKADHQRVTLALAMLDEANLAFASLQRQAAVA